MSSSSKPEGSTITTARERSAWSAATADAPLRIARALPGFAIHGPVFRTAKCLLCYGALDGRAAIAKLTGPREGPWRWYARRELALYRALQRAPAPVLVPQLLAWDEREELIVLERLDGAPLCETRACAVALGSAVITALIETLDRWAALDPLDARWPSILPDEREQRALRARLLEDPSAPLAWVREGLWQSAELGLLEQDAVDRALDALDAHPVVRASHGDLLLRNVLRTPRGIGWIDLECAGAHAQGWDLALLWVNAAREDRPLIEQATRRLGDARAHRAWAACALFAIARERLYRTRSRARAPDARERSLREDEASLLQIL